MDLNLKPIETVEEVFTEEPSEVFPYADFPPPPFSALNLHKLALSKSENWKATMGPAEGCTEHVITRLLEMQRLQHSTVQRERPRLQTTFCTPAVTERPSSAKAVPKIRQPKLSDCLSLQMTWVDKVMKKEKTVLVLVSWHKMLQNEIGAMVANKNGILDHHLLKVHPQQNN